MIDRDTELELVIVPQEGTSEDAAERDNISRSITFGTSIGEIVDISSKTPPRKPS